MDKEKAMDMAKKTAKNIKDKSQELVDLAIDKGTPILTEEGLYNIIKYRCNQNDFHKVHWTHLRQRQPSY